MKVDTLSAGAQSAGVSASRQPSNDGGFQAVLAQAQSAAGSVGSSSAAAKAAAAQPVQKNQYTDALDFFRDYLSKTPEQHLREAIMKEMGITEEELAALPPAEHAAKEGEIERRMKERMLGTKEGEQPKDSQQAAAAAAALSASSTGASDMPPVNQTVIANINAAAKGLSGLSGVSSVSLF
ncbi:MAG TPA: hypothetical protein VFW68_04010 [Rhodocyclaceae bacterium]|nr:hypothetical protein [Rhodocyclaceae bacterium]